MDKTWLNYLSLSDDYERRARLIPGVLTTVFLLPVSAMYAGPVDVWIQEVLVGVGVGAVISVGISHLSSALGNRFQRKLWPDWPHDSPTNRWLNPEDRTVSRQQKERWYAVINRVVGLDVQSSIERNDANELKAVINDAVKAVRDRLWRSPEENRLRLHNIEYGFARNFTGLRPIWLSFALFSAVGCWIAYICHGGPLLWCVVSTAIALVAIPLAFLVLPGYVRKKADFYAESFFGALSSLEKV